MQLRRLLQRVHVAPERAISCLSAHGFSTSIRHGKDEQQQNKPKSVLSILSDFTAPARFSVSTLTSAAAAAATPAALTAVEPSVITTAAGYTLTPAVVSAISWAPLVAFAFVQASGISPIQRIFADKKTGNLSPFPFISLYTNCAIWTLYGILQNDSTVLFANAAGVIAGVTYTALFQKYTHLNMIKYYAGSIAILCPLLSSPIVLDTANAVNLLGSVGCASAVILMASPLAVVKHVIDSQSTEAMPFTVSLAMTINGLSWAAYGWFVANDVFIYSPNILGFGSGLIQLSLFAIYPTTPAKRDTNDIEK